MVKSRSILYIHPKQTSVATYSSLGQVIGDKLKHQGGIATGESAGQSKWQLTCRLYVHEKTYLASLQHAEKQKENLTRSLYVVTNSQSTADGIYSLVAQKWSNQSEEVPIEASKALLSIINKLKNVWMLRQTATIEGQVYELQSTRIYVAYVQIGNSDRGFIVYITTDSSLEANDCWRRKIHSHLDSLLQCDKGIHSVVQTANEATHDYLAAQDILGLLRSQSIM